VLFYLSQNDAAKADSLETDAVLPPLTQAASPTAAEKDILVFYHKF
jgi:hypothetical protein